MTSQHLSHLVWSRHSLKVFLAVILTVLVSQGHGFKLYHGYYNSLFRPVVEQSFKAKVETLGAILKRHVQQLRSTENRQVDLVFLVDSSASVGSVDFQEEIKFVRKLLADFTVDLNTTRVAVITFSSREKVVRQVDHLTRPGRDKHKCSLLVEEIPRIKYVGGGTFTLGAFLEAKKVLKAARPDAQKAVFLITDGFSNGGDPRPEARRLKQEGVKIFTFGIRNGNVRELWEMASEPRNETCYVLDSFEEFEALARRALHSDLHSGTFMPQPPKKCSRLCINGGFCCHSNASCTCGTHTGKYECLCKPGYYGNGLGKDGCKPCPSGTYKNHTGSGDVSVCTPCPDENQETLPGATLVHECKCKRGFRNFNSTECTVFRCPDLKEPKHGYFVNNQCNNVFNAACGLRCRPGYELRGSSLRICQEDGSWSGQDTECVLKTCPALPAPKNGHMVCTTDDFRYPTVCRFTCQAGYQLLGSRKRSCLAIAFWTGIAARCREITCPPLPEIRDGLITPAACSEGEVPFGTTCQLSCLLGYKLHGPPAKQCTPDGTWSAISNEPSQCIDQTPPFMQCPDNIEVGADEDNDTTEVTWPVPVAVDNSGFIPVLTSDPAVVPPERFPIGITIVTYRAEDLSQNVAKCKFYVLVIDEVPPRVDKCFSPDPVVSSGDYSNVTWEEPIFSDNSGRVDVQASHSPGLFPQGHTTVVYTAFDRNGNNNTCTLDIVVSPHSCQYPDPPVNGERTCRESEEGVHCVLSCKPGHAFVKAPPPEYFCAYDNVWTPEDQMPFPDCASQSISNEVLQPASITLSGDLSCAEHKFLNRVEQNIEAKVNDKVSTLCEDNVICDIAEIQTSCEEHDEDFNKINLVANLKRRRRSVNRHGQWTRRASLKFDFTLEGTVNTTGEPKEDAMQQQEELSQSMKRLLSALQTQAKEGQFDMYVGGRWLRFSDMDFDVRRHTFSCEEGTVLMNNTCVSCPLGMFYNVVLRECRSCPVGTYQPREGQVACLVCPEKTSTSTEHARSDADCRAQCLPGSISPTGLERCETCEEGSYQPKYAQTTCLPCPDGSTTLRRGARTEDQCRERCKPGHVSRTGLAPCYPCPPGTYQPDEAQIACIKCPHDSKTNSSAANSIGECQVELDLQSDDAGAYQNQQQQLLLQASACFSNPCRNGATCETKENGLFDCKCAPGFEGVFCQQETDQCQAKPCLNGGTCSPLPGTYRCDCPDGFKGQKCERNVDECESSPCKNGGTCVDGANSFTCNCPNGFQGVTCENDVNDCEDEPCLNGGTCEDDVSGYRCTCPDGFSGTTCEIERDECLSAPCENGGLCVDEPGAYRCECVGGYTGEQCEMEILECASSPCQNGAKCEDLINSYLCHCQEGYTGVHCESEVDAHYQLDFPVASTVDFAQMPIDRPLTALTVSFWMKSDDIDNFGTPFSYAVGENDNTLTLTDYNGFVFYVNQENVVTDIPTNDGLWHHVVLTWSSVRGSWKIYVDGLLNDSGFDLSTARPVPGKGVLVIGQEQDSMGGGFTASESFVGSITQFNIWDEELSLTTIENMRTSCGDFHGNVVAWPDVQAALRGSLSPQPSTFCQDCTVPIPHEHGSADYDSLRPGSKVTFSCKRGFYVAGRDTSMCLVTGEWENETPPCLRVECGRPGTILNGYYEGWKFSFDNRVRFRCNEGYKLKGPDTLYCNEDGVWDGERPDCVEITCDLPLLSENTVHKNPQDKYLPGYTATLACAPGHKLLTAHDSVSCQSDGTWDRSVPTCDPQKCGTPPFIDNGEPDTAREEYSVGDIVRYICDYGFKLNDAGPNPKGAISCLPTGKWESILPECVIKRCQEPPLVPYATIDGTERTFLSRVTYECQPGYVLDGSGAIECLEDEQWDPEPPSCEPVDCGAPPELPNGFVTGSVFSYNSIVTCGCQPGYKLVGSMRRRCTEDGVWEGEDPVCKPVSCGRLTAPQNGRVIAPVITFQAEATYECNEGYNLQGDATRTCGEDARWSGAEPQCEIVSCPPAIDIEHGSYKAPPAYTFGARLVYSCQQGYVLRGKADMECESTGFWSNEVPACDPVQCPDPDSPDHGTASALGLIYTSKVEYTCDSDYRLDGPDVRTCEADGAWSGEEPVCVLLACEPPPPIDNGRYDFKDLKVGSIVRYTCDPGHKLQGEEVRRCLSSLVLDGEEPQCIAVKCPAPEAPAYGDVTLSDVTLIVGTVATYDCDLGYLLKGETERTCGEDGSFSGAVPACDPVECTKPAEIISNGRMLGTSFTFNSTISYVCDEGYRMVGAERRVCQASGKWDQPIPVCLIVECPRATIVNGYASTFRREFGTEVSFTCRTGYRLEGPQQRTCMADGTWSGDDTICVKIICPPPPPLENGSSRNFNETTAVYSCNLGFRLTGPDSSRCDDNGLWDPAPPTCEMITCEDLSGTTLENGRIIFTSTLYGTYVRYECNLGYNLMGASERVCTASGKWEGTAPVCERIACPDFRPFLNGTIVGDGRRYGDGVIFICHSGFELQGQQDLSCQMDGTWNADQPECVNVNCGDPPVLDHATPDVINGTLYPAIITYNCDTGYEARGSGISTCQADKSWSVPELTCERVNCGDPPVLDHATPDLVNGTLYSAIITYICDFGYKARGSGISTCQADKSWSETELTCERVNCGDPPVLDHATPDLVNGTLYSAIITYICDFGYKARGSGISTCQADKSWSETELTCERVNCGDPPVLDHATPDLVNGTLYSATITYICDFGYKARGSGISTCQADKSWSETELTCDLVSCPKIPARNLPNGEVEGDNFTVGGVIRFTCNIGYRLQGVSSCTCRLDGTWSSPVPSCIVVECSDPLPLVQGSVSVRGYKYNHTATYECDTGYQLDGQSVARCTETGEWSESDRTCKLVTCQAPADVIPNGRLLNPKTSYEYRDLAEYECDAGYEEVGASAIICTADGTFSPVPPTCAKIQCPKPETPSLGYVDVENDTLVYYCLEGFELVGQQRRRCLETGQWEGVAPVCVPILCPLPAPFADGSLQGNEYTFGSSLTYTCNEGYTLAGEETPERETTRKCLATRQWSGEEPVCEPVDCGAPRSIEFGTMMGESYLYNDTVLYDCEYGYSLIGPHERTCQANGEWSGDEPYCYEILCEYPPEVANATYDPGDYDGSFFVGALVFYMCKPGHVMISSSAVMCESNGMWSEPLPECPPVVCPKLLAPENGDVTGDDITYKGQLRFSCHDGYRLSGAGDTLTCTEAGTWDLEVPTCELLTCPDPYFEHGVTRLQDQEDDDPPPTTFLPGHYVRFQCEPGYRLAGPLTARCNATGQWSISAFPVCRPITCDKPIEISHAGVSGGPVYYAGDTATYTCIEGYDIEGTATITCGADGLWVGGQPKCVDMTCPGPPSVPNAQADWDGDTVSAGEHVQYECDEGFTLDLGHDGRLLCLKGGNWSADAPSCVRVECGPPPEVDNSHLNFGSVYYSGETVTYTCYLGYELEGTATLTCGVNGTWEGESPTCVDVICDDPPYLENAYMVETGEGEETAAGGWVQYECDEGFVMDAGHDGRVSCLRGGQWSTDIPQCVPVECGQPPEVEHAKFLFQAPVYVGDLVTYTCNVGYEVDDTATLECGEDGSWVGETPRCVDVTCDSAPYIEHGFEVPGTSTETPAGEWIEYECELGFRIDPDHDGRVYCLKGGEWTSDLPTCISVVCEAPPAVEHANFIANAEYSYGDVVTYFCQSGYELEAAATITCSWNGSWTGETPRCVDVICDTPPSIDHGRVTGAPALTSAGKFIQYECDEGFTLDAGHDGRVMCVRGGEWSADLPSCVPVECTAPPEIPEALYTESGPYQAGDIVTYVCNEGFDLEDAATLMCGTDGLWMGQTPRCVRITCTNHPYIEHGRVVGTAPGAHTPAGQWVQYECDEGFQLGDSHDGRLSCLRGGSWGTDVPVCIHVDCGPPPVPFHASVTTTGSSAGSIAFVTCNVGYRLPSGQREMQVVCDVSGTWAGSDDVRCLARDCGSPPTVRHSQPLSDVDTTYDNRVTYRCNHGYEISGEPTLRCSESGRWEVETVGSPLPTCAPVTCGPPETDMQIVGSDFTLGGVVTLACPDGWRLIGPEQITCTADRVWSPSPGHCEKITCRALEVPENAYIFSGSGEAGAETGSRVELLCDEGFLLAGDPVVTCMPDGNWTSPLPSCELLRDASAVCEETVEAENALPPPARFLPGDSAVLSCRPGYRPEGDMTSLCKGDRTWTLPSGSCVRVSCGPPPVEDAGTVKVFGNSFLFGDTVMYMCRPGLAPACLPPRLTCTETGQWDGKASCSAQCKRPCQNGGRCVAFNRCKCRPGYTGAQCQLPICILPCLNGGTCQAPYSCKCPSGYYGSRCHKAHCDRPCQNGGRCLHPNRCQCFNGYKPPFCEK